MIHRTEFQSGRVAGQSAWFRAGSLWLLMGLAALTGCGRPQVGANNYRLIESMRTAISARRADWLDENVKLISQRHASGEMNDEQFGAFESILALVRGGDWAGAESEVIRLAKAQQPSSAELELLKSKKSSHYKK
jgi:hypothetical protein